MKLHLPQNKILRGVGAFADGLRARSLRHLSTGELKSRVSSLPDAGRAICDVVEKADAAIEEAERALMSAKVQREVALEAVAAVLRSDWSTRELRTAGIILPSP